VVARIRPQDGSGATTWDTAGTGTSWSASSGTSARGLSGPAPPTEVTTSQVGPHQSTSTSQAGTSGGDVIGGMGQQSTRAGPVSTETPSCIRATTVRDGKTTGRRETEPRP
jgi:hypothetical protein